MTDAKLDRPKLDIIGDIHGQLEPLERLGAELGYDVGGNWSHPEGRRLVFLGDLVDRGPQSFEVAELVRGLCAGGSALCLLGNHELNLIEWRHGRARAKHSNRETIEDIQRGRGRWNRALKFFESLPLALELDDLRLTHAMWHLGCIAELRTALGTESTEHPVHERWRPYIALHAAFEEGDLRPGVPDEPFEDQSEKSLEVLVKGRESQAPDPFKDNDGKQRNRIRTEWWRPERDEVAKDKRIIFGHYWNMPPIPGHHDAFVPPYPSGHPGLRRWLSEHHGKVVTSGRVQVPDHVNAVCIDFTGVTRAAERACVGAYRYPEGQISWMTCRLTREPPPRAPSRPRI